MATIDTVFKITASVVGGNAIKDLSKSIKEVSTGGENMRRSLTQGALALKAFAATAAVGTITAFIKGSIDLADHMNDLSQRTGTAVEDLAKFAVAAEKSGTSLDEVAVALNKLARAQISSQDATSKQASAFKALFGNAEGARVALLPTSELLLRIADRFKEFPDGAIKSALAIELLGRSGANMIPMLNGGRESMTKFGLAIDTDMAQKADRFNDMITDINTNFRNLGLTLADSVMPVLNGLSKVFESNSAAAQLLQIACVGIVWAIKGIAIAAVAVFGSFNAIVKELANSINATINNVIIVPINAALEKLNQLSGSSFSKLPTFQTQGLGENYSNSIGNMESGIKTILGFGENPSAASGGGKGREPKYSPDAAGKAASDAERLNEALRKKLLLLQADTNSIGMNNSEKEKAQVLAEFEAKGLEKSSEGYKKLSDALDANTKAHRSFSAGAREAFAEYADAASNAAAQAKNVITNSLKSMEDAMVDFVTTGKLNFRDLASSIIKDLARIMVQQSITGPLSGMLGGLFGGGGAGFGAMGASIRGFFNPSLYGPGFASGGDHRGGLRIVGENGPELEATGPSRIFTANQTRQMLSGGGGGSTNVSVVVNMDQGGQTNTKSDSQQGVALGNMIASTVKSMLINEKRPGGLLAT